MMMFAAATGFLPLFSAPLYAEAVFRSAHPSPGERHGAAPADFRFESS
jgi:hypothetical protein